MSYKLPYESFKHKGKLPHDDARPSRLFTAREGPISVDLDPAQRRKRPGAEELEAVVFTVSGA
jgi:hypothetical protein